MVDPTNWPRFYFIRAVIGLTISAEVGLVINRDILTRREIAVCFFELSL